MRSLATVLYALLFGFALAGTATAGLIDLGNGVVHDNLDDTDPTNDLYWFQDMSHLVSQNYSDQLTGITALNQTGSGFGGAAWGDWQMAGWSEMVSLWRNSPADITSTFKESKAWPTVKLFDGRYDEISSPEWHYMAWVIGRDDGSFYRTSLQDNNTWDVYAQSDRGAWVVAGAAAAAVPIPAPAGLVLMGLGLAWLAGRRRRR